MVTVMKMMAIGMEVVMMESIEIVIGTGMRIVGEIRTMEGKRIVTGTILMRMTDTVPGKQMIGMVTNTGAMRKILTEHTMMMIITLRGFLLSTSMTVAYSGTVTIQIHNDFAWVMACRSGGVRDDDYRRDDW
jgi:hypothetical protein